MTAFLLTMTCKKLNQPIVLLAAAKKFVVLAGVFLCPLSIKKTPSTNQFYILALQYCTEQYDWQFFTNKKVSVSVATEARKWHSFPAATTWSQLSDSITRA